MRALLVSLALAAAVTGGCATMTDAMDRSLDVGTISQQKSTFDGATVVTVSPAYLYDPAASLGVQARLGAIWLSTRPDTVALQVEYHSRVDSARPAYRGITGLDVNLDGRVHRFDAGATTQLGSSSYNQVSRTIYTSSGNVVVIPMDLLEAMARSSDCRIRIHTTAGSEDAVFSTDRIPGGQATAVHYIRPFLAKVDAIRLAAGP